MTTTPATRTSPAATTAPPPRAGPADTPRYFNRDLSWLEFNRRVLRQATDPRTPLLTRVRFLSIFASNLDEFFMKRVGYLKRAADAGVESRSSDGRTPRDTLAAARSIVIDLQAEADACFERELRPALDAEGVRVLAYADLPADDRRDLEAWFTANVFPVLTPLAVDPGHRFPFISNLSESLGVLLSAPGRSDRLFARVKVPDVLPRLVGLPPDRPVGDGSGPVRLVPLDEIIRHNLDDLFPGMQIHEVMPFRVTRSAAVDYDEDAHDLLQSVEAELRLRRFARAVRLEAPPGASAAMIDTVARALLLSADDVYERTGPLEYGDYLQVADFQRPALRTPPWRPPPPRRLADPGADLFKTIRERDVLLHHPYESFRDSVERFIAAAARDPNVLAIKQTIYRTSRDSPFVSSLVQAAEAGKQVACLVEVRARFDEQKNVRFARLLEKSGVHVAYGVVGLKTHCKCSLVVRREETGLRSYAHFGTGNYNPSTAQLYTDVGLLTADPVLTQDAVAIFNLLTGRSLQREYQELLVAPFAMRDRFASLIDGEIAVARSGGRGRIVAKMNALEDAAVAEKLYEASAAGVDILLIVRGFCCLRPGVPGLSDRIRVISVIGRFLEHSRIFHFGMGRTDPADGAWYIASADWMHRNLSDRVELAVPVKDPEARRRLARILEVMAADHRDAWDLEPTGAYRQRRPRPDMAHDPAHTQGTFATLMSESPA